MQTSLTIIRYKNWAVPFAVLSMAIFRIPFFLNQKISFFKLMGSGKNGTFDKNPDFNQWAIFAVHKNKIVIDNQNQVVEELYGKFIKRWIQLFSEQQLTFILEPLSGHGLWDKKMLYTEFKERDLDKYPIATLTRATIRLSKLNHFWKNVAPIANKMTSAKGYIYSIGIGEVPWIKQATFSIWESIDDMKNFAYSMKEHSEVIKKTRKEKWYTEDMFVRFHIVATLGNINGFTPLKRKQ